MEFALLPSACQCQEIMGFLPVILGSVGWRRLQQWELCVCVCFCTSGERCQDMGGKTLGSHCRLKLSDFLFHPGLESPVLPLAGWEEADERMKTRSLSPQKHGNHTSRWDNILTSFLTESTVESSPIKTGQSFTYLNEKP